MEKLLCAECKDLLRTAVLCGDALSIGVYFCVNKQCKRVYLLTIGGFKPEDGAAAETV